MYELLVVPAGFAVLFALAFVNGANDVGKIVAGLIVATKGDQPKPASITRAVVWGALFSGVGSIAAIYVSGRLFLVFTQDLVKVPLGESFALSVLVAATVWVVATTLLRIPVSSTHTIIGAIVFLLIYLYGTSGIQWNVLLLRVLLPMAASPFLALLATYVFHRLAHGRSAMSGLGPGRVKILHWGSAALTSFSRGINDAPKMAALGFFLLPFSSQDSLWLPYAFVSLALFIGSISWGRKITESLVSREEQLDDDQRLRAGLTTAALVSAGAIFGAPISTTHVAAAAKAGARANDREVFWSTTGNIILAWAITFPVAGLLTILASMLLPH